MASRFHSDTLVAFLSLNLPALDKCSDAQGCGGNAKAGREGIAEVLNSGITGDSLSLAREIDSLGASRLRQVEVHVLEDWVVIVGPVFRVLAAKRHFNRVDSPASPFVKIPLHVDDLAHIQTSALFFMLPESFAVLIKSLYQDIKLNSVVRPASHQFDVKIELRQIAELNVGTCVFARENLGIDGIPLLLELEFYAEAIRIWSLDSIRLGDMPVARVVEKRVSVVANVEGHVLPHGAVSAIPKFGVFAVNGDSDGDNVEAAIKVDLQIDSLIQIARESRLLVRDLLAVRIDHGQDGFIGILIVRSLPYHSNVEVNSSSALEDRHVYDLVTRDLQAGASLEISVLDLVSLIILGVPVDAQAVIDTPLFHELVKTIL